MPLNFIGGKIRTLVLLLSRENYLFEKLTIPFTKYRSVFQRSNVSISNSNIYCIQPRYTTIRIVQLNKIVPIMEKTIYTQSRFSRLSKIQLRPNIVHKLDIKLLFVITLHFFVRKYRSQPCYFTHCLITCYKDGI